MMVRTVHCVFILPYRPSSSPLWPFKTITGECKEKLRCYVKGDDTGEAYKVQIKLGFDRKVGLVLRRYMALVSFAELAMVGAFVASLSAFSYTLFGSIQ